MSTKRPSYSETYQGLQSEEHRQSVARWIKTRCQPVRSARYALDHLYATYCLDAQRPSWPEAGSMSVAMFSRALIEFDEDRIVRRKANKTYIVGLQPDSLLPKPDDSI